MRVQTPTLTDTARTHLWWPLAASGLFIATCSAAGLDFLLADQIYALGGQRWYYRHGFVTEVVIHRGGRMLTGLMYLAALLAFALSYTRVLGATWRRPLGYVLLATLCASLAVGWIKSWSGVDCPWDLTRYGGDQAFIGLLSTRPLDSARAACFPSGHAGSGYAWLSLYFFGLLTKPSWRWWGLSVGLSMGLVFGIGQQLRGAHFLSHDVWSATICWVVVTITFAALYRRRSAVQTTN